MPWFLSYLIIYIKSNVYKHDKLEINTIREQLIFVSSDGTPDNVPLVPQNRHGMPEKSDIIGWSLEVRLKMTFFTSIVDSVLTQIAYFSQQLIFWK